MELLKRKDKSEAIKWLTGAPKGVHRNVGELSNADSIEYVKKLYTLGAREVVVVKIGVNGKYESTDTLIATLPSEPPARKAIFASEVKRVKEMGYEKDPDVGPKYLFLWFD